MSFPRIKPFADHDAFMAYANLEREFNELIEARHNLIKEDGLRSDYEKLESRIQELKNKMFLVDLERQVDACAFKIHELTGCTQIEAQSLARALVCLHGTTPWSTRRTVDEVSQVVPDQLSRRASDFLTVGEMREHLITLVDKAEAAHEALIHEANTIKDAMNREDVTISMYRKLQVRLNKITNSSASMFMELASAHSSLEYARQDLSTFEEQLNGVDDDLNFFAHAFMSSHKNRSHRQLEIEEADHEVFGASRSAMAVYGFIMGHLRTTYPDLASNHD